MNTSQSVRMLLQRLPTLCVSMDSGDQDPVLVPKSSFPGHALSMMEWSTQWRHWVEVLELLVLTWQVDKHAWLQLVTEKGSIPIYGYSTRDGYPPVCWIHLPHTQDPEAIRVFLDAVFIPIGDNEYSSEFHGTRAGLLSQGGRETMEPIAIGLVLSDERSNQRELITRWFEAVRDAPLRCSLAGVGFLNAANRQGIDRLRLQVGRGLSIGRADIVLPRGDALVTRHELNKLLSVTFGGSGAKWINVVAVNAVHESLEAFFSKLTDVEAQDNDQVRSLVCRVLRQTTSHSERRSSMLWFLYGLFSQDAHHSISYLFYSTHNSVDLSGEMRWLTELLRTHGAPPLELLFPNAYNQGVEFEAPTHDQWLVIPRGYPIHVELGGDSQDHTLTFADRVARFRVVRDDPTLQFIDILVPGYGLCWVRRSETLAIEAAPLTRWTFNQHSIRSMELEVLDVGPFELDGLLQILGLVGAPVQSLCITRRMPRTVDRGHRFLGVEQLTALLACCPQLATLRLVNVEVLEFALQQLYELDQCNIKKIELSGLSVVRRGPTRALILALANSEQRIARTLQELWLDMSHVDLADREGEESLILSVISMLAINQVLKTVSLHISPSDFDRYRPQLRDRILPVRKAPLPLRAKCALLSIVEYMGLSPEHQVLANVLEFAAECETRVVTVTTSPPTDL